MLDWFKGEKVDHPFADAKHAKEVIGAFSASDPWQAIEDVSHWVESVNSTAGFKLDKRYELLDALDVAARRSHRKLLDNYTALKSADRVHERRIWATAPKFWKLLADGYLLCLDQAQDHKNVSGAMKPRLPVIAARGTRALRNQIKWVLMRYGMVRPEIWGEIARCTSFAEVGGGADAVVEIYPGDSGSVRHEFLRIMMFWAASPGGLAQVEQDIAERVIVLVTPKFGFSVKPSESSEYCFDLDGQRPPLRWMPSVPPMVAPRYFDAIEAHKAVQALLATLTSTGVVPSDLVLSAGANTAAATRVLNYLLLNWAKEMPPRAAERRKTAISLRIVHGYENVLGAVAPELAGSGDELDFASATEYETWVAEDVSARGYGMVAPAGKGGWLKVGVLVGVRTESESSWSIGIVRRVKGDAHQQFRIGVQLIAKAPMPVNLSLADGGAKSENALLLAPTPSPNGSLHVVARRDIFFGNVQWEGVYGNPPVTVTLDAAGAIESGDDFDWLRFKASEREQVLLMSLKLDISGR